MDEKAYTGNDHQHRRRKRIEEQAKVQGERGGVRRGAHDARVNPGIDDLVAG